MKQMSHHQSKYLSRIIHYKFYRRLLLTVFILLIVLFASIGLILFRQFSVYANGQIAAFSTDLMAQQVGSTQNLWQEMNALSNSMQADQNITSFLVGRQKTPLVRYHAYRSLGKYKALYPFIYNISLHNLSTQERLNLLYLKKEDDIWDPERIALGETITQPRRIALPSGGAEVLTLVFPIRYYSQNITCFISIDIQLSHLQTMLASRNAGSHTYIIGEQDQLLVPSADGYMPDDWASVVSDLRSKQKDQGSFYRNTAGVNALISYCRFPSQSWTVVSIQPAEGLLAAARSQIGTLLFFLGGLLLLSLITMFILMLRIYRPIDQLISQLPHEQGAMVDEMALISNELTVYRDQSDTMKQNLYQSNIQSLLLGLPCDMVELPVSITGSNCFVVGVLSPTRKHEYTVDELNRLSASHLSGLKECISFRWTDHRVLVFCFDGPQGFPSEAMFEKFCQACRQQHNSQVRLGLSDVVDKPDLLHLAYQEALRVSADFFYHEDRILFTTASASPLRSTPSTPTNNWISRISGFLFHEQTDELNQVLQDFFSECRQLPPSFCSHVVCDVLHQCIELVQSTCQPQNAGELTQLLEQIEQASTFNCMHDMSMELFSLCHRLLNESEQQRSLLRGQRIIHQVCDLVQKRYTDPSFSLQDAADAVSLSSGYLGRLFKQTTGQSFAEYLTACRLQVAEKKLLETDIPITIISKEIGMENASYFSTVFRKTYGMSPSLFRETANTKKNPVQQEGEKA